MLFPSLDFLILFYYYFFYVWLQQLWQRGVRDISELVLPERYLLSARAH